ENVDLWYETNPSLGLTLKERPISNEIGKNEAGILDFNIQRLGLWLRYTQKSAITETEWMRLKCDVLPKVSGPLYIGVKYNQDGGNMAMSIAGWTDEDKIFTEAIDCRPIRAGNDWVLEYITALGSYAGKVVVDGAAGQQLLKEQMQKKRLKPPVLPTVGQIISANSSFEHTVLQRKLCHMGQPSLSWIISNCDHRAIGSGGGFGYKSLKPELDISLMDSVVLAAWAADEFRQKKRKQVISY
ncbi:MAG: terminase, partial [Lachnospiraceae bacterium]|nr:terminase [Lachnospiraceae bacterium]